MHRLELWDRTLVSTSLQNADDEVWSAGDNIVDLRAASRTKPNFAQGSVGFSIENGIKFDTNVARKQLEDLRKSLRWDVVPVITGFDPKYNQDKTLW